MTSLHFRTHFFNMKNWVLFFFAKYNFLKISKFSFVKKDKSYDFYFFKKNKNHGHGYVYISGNFKGVVIFWDCNSSKLQEIKMYYNNIPIYHIQYNNPYFDKAVIFNSSFEIIIDYFNYLKSVIKANELTYKSFNLNYNSFNERVCEKLSKVNAPQFIHFNDELYFFEGRYSSKHEIYNNSMNVNISDFINSSYIKACNINEINYFVYHAQDSNKKIHKFSFKRSSYETCFMNIVYDNKNGGLFIKTFSQSINMRFNTKSCHTTGNLISIKEHLADFILSACCPTSILDMVGIAHHNEITQDHLVLIKSILI